MELYAGLPYWVVKNPLFEYHNPLGEDISADVVIIGSGITGALTAHELCTAGYDCVMIDHRGIGQGSSVASTALLQYEIDTTLHELAGMMGEKQAVIAYRSCLEAIFDIKKILDQTGVDAAYEQVPNVFYASDRNGVKSLEKEYRIRDDNGLPVSYLDSGAVRKRFGFDAPSALFNDVSAQMDPYAAAVGLVKYHMKHSRLRVYTYTDVKKIDEKSKHCLVRTSDGPSVKCSDVVVAAGFEAGRFMRKKVMKLTSTYAIISEPVAPEKLWPGRAMIWETADPYLYIRTDGNRVIVGGEDEEFKDPVKRNRQLRRKAGILEEKFKKLFPDLGFVTDMAWCGTFSSTHDGLPFIGLAPGKKHTFFALGYGGNGITFSMAGAQLMRNMLSGRPDEREAVYGFDRLKR